MTREEAARVLTELADEYEKYELSKNGWLGTTYIPAHRMGVAALRGPQPDPTTGLVPCGCGGKPKKYTTMEGLVLVQCQKCGVSTLHIHPDDAYIVKLDWNHAMGMLEVEG